MDALLPSFERVCVRKRPKGKNKIVVRVRVIDNTILYICRGFIVLKMSQKIAAYVPQLSVNERFFKDKFPRFINRK